MALQLTLLATATDTRLDFLFIALGIFLRGWFLNKGRLMVIATRFMLSGRIVATQRCCIASRVSLKSFVLPIVVHVIIIIRHWGTGFGVRQQGEAYVTGVVVCGAPGCR